MQILVSTYLYTYTRHIEQSGGMAVYNTYTLTLHMTVTMLQLTITASFSFLQQLCLFLDILDQVFPREGIQLKQQ